MEIKGIFLSRCTDEFGDLSKKICAHYKNSERYFIKEQSSFGIQYHTLEELQKRIMAADMVIQLIGDNPGTAIGTERTDEFREGNGDWLDNGKSKIYKELQDSKLYWKTITYTEWEAYIALHFDIPLRCYDLRKNKGDGSSHSFHLERLRNAAKLHPTSCDEDKVIRDISTYLENPSNYKKKAVEKVAPIEIDDTRLPACLDTMGAIDFVGRAKDLAGLDRSLKKVGRNKTRVIQIVADGGTGKTKLVARWIHSRRQATLTDNSSLYTSLHENDLKFFNKGSIFAYSLYAQGTNKLTQKDQDGNIINASDKATVGSAIWEKASEWFDNDTDFKKVLQENETKNSKDKARILAEKLINRKEPTLLILDGLEAALGPTEVDRKLYWTPSDDFLKYFLKYFLDHDDDKTKEKASQYAVILTTRVQMTIRPLEYTDRMIKSGRLIVKNIKPLAFKSEEDEAASVLYYYSIRGHRKKSAAEILTKASYTKKPLLGNKAKIVRDELLLDHKNKLPNDLILKKNLRSIAKKLEGHALSLKLAGQLVAYEIDNWDGIAQHLDFTRYQSKPRPSDRKDFSRTVKRVRQLLNSHIMAFQNDYPHNLKALLAVGVFDREANFCEIEYAATYLDNIDNLGKSTSEELKLALDTLTVDTFLNSDGSKTTTDDNKKWDCHPLIRSRLCMYPFEVDPEKANKCHHMVANFFIKKTDDKLAENIINSLNVLNEIGQKDYMRDQPRATDDDDNKTGRKNIWSKMDKRQAIHDMLSLQRAVYHFILASELRNAWHLYWEWMSVQKEYIFSRFLGKFHDDLVTLSYFFESPWSSIKETKEEKQKLSPIDIASLFDAAGFRLRSLSRLAEAHQASGGSFLEWNKANWSPHGTLSEEKRKKTLRESSYAAGNRAEYSMVQASLADALMYANLAVRLADESEDSRARFVHRVELAEILWQRGGIEQAVELLEWVNCKSNIQFSKKKIKMGDNYITQRQWAELYCLYRYRYGKILVSQGDLKEAQYMAETLENDLKNTNWLLNIGLWHLLNGYIKLAKARPTWIISPQFTYIPENGDSRAILNSGKEQFEKAQEKFKEISAGHHELKAEIGSILCSYGICRAKSCTDSISFEDILNMVGERHLFQIDVEVANALILQYTSKTDDTQKDPAKQQIELAKILCVKSGYLRHLPFLDPLSQDK